MARKSRSTSTTPTPVSELDGFGRQLAIWMARLLIETGGYRQIESRPFREQVLHLLGLEALLDDNDIGPDGFRRHLEVQAEAIRSSGVGRDGELFENVERLGELLELSPAERELLAFGVMANINTAIEETLKDYWGGSTRQLHVLLGRVLGIEVPQVSAALRSSSFLAKTGLLRIRRSSERLYRCPMDVMDILVDLITSDHADEAAMLACFYRPAPPSGLKRADFPHVEDHLDLLVPYLSAAIERKMAGVNVLIHGKPGLGKTELARVLASEASADMVEVAAEDGDGDPLPGKKRIAAYQVCQRLLTKRRRPLVLFDEIEDVLGPPSFMDMFPETHQPVERKGGMNRLLEENPVPTLWIVNEVSHIDPALLRRFSYVLKMTAPPRDARRSMLEKHLDGVVVDAPWKESMAANDAIRPADIEVAARVVRTIGTHNGQRNQQLIEQVLQSALSVRRLPAFAATPRIEELDYDLTVLNTDCNLDRLAGALRPTSRGSICLYGPSGTGKTAFARHLASRTGMELLAMRASDLFDKYVGENEKNIADMFRQARQAGAVLLLDEADSFLADRRGAEKRWEYSQVNELLVQMEQFEGLFVCSTNLVDRLDHAVFRRFDIKIRFDTLKREGRLRLFEKTSDALAIPFECADRADIDRQLDRLDALTPGDFAAVLRRARLLCEHWSPGELLEALAEECAIKPGRSRPVGFGAQVVAGRPKPPIAP